MTTKDKNSRDMTSWELFMAYARHDRYGSAPAYMAEAGLRTLNQNQPYARAEIPRSSDIA